ncbi:MAG: type I-C CRISPR-associated protein Cas8c/Csd1 [Eubacteriales bacterium]|nr:type I-C CRISPR-associated protein Cas8c/Csd1 [Eubacteriales bacterium]
MILQSLVKHYETLARKGLVTLKGWCSAKVSYGIDLRKDGTVRGIVCLKQEEIRGKKTVWVPQNITVPQMVARSSGVSANFLCDNSKYLLGVDKDGSSGRVKECFEAARKLHLDNLKTAHGEMAQALKAFFSGWEPDKARECADLDAQWEEITAAGNLIFVMGPQYAQEDPEIREIWETILQESEGERDGICLVTGQKAEITRIHTVIKGVQGAQSSGAALVSFNAPAFESYGKEQSYNAPVGKYAAFAYTTALNYLLSQRKYVFQFGDTTVLFWAESGEEAYQEAFFFSIEPEIDNQESVRGVFAALKENRPVVIDDIRLNPDQKFFILGLSPNAARLSVRFYYEDSFGKILENLDRHYKRMEIVRPSWDDMEYLGVNRMIQQTVNQNSRDKKPKPNMASAALQAILSGGNYPESLYSNVLIRIRSEQGRVTRGRAAIIKAYLLKNKKVLEKEGAFVKLNEETNDRAYVLGRIFAVLEAIQEDANRGINATIRDKYFNSASAAPATIFPVLFKLKNSHIRKLENPGARVNYEKLITELMGKIDEFPLRLSLEEQGKFDLGYYHQVQKRYEKKEEK